MILTAPEIKEIQDIVKNFSDKDKEHIEKETEYLCRTYAPLIDVIRDYKPDEHTKDAADYLELDDVNFQDAAGELFWKLMEYRVSRELAMSVFKRRHTYGEAA